MNTLGCVLEFVSSKLGVGALGEASCDDHIITRFGARWIADRLDLHCLHSKAEGRFIFSRSPKPMDGHDKRLYMEIR